MQRTLAILLLLAATIHPVVHVSHDAIVCPCIHIASAELPVPLAGMPVLEGDALAERPDSVILSTTPSSAGPSRAPPHSV